MEINTDTHPLSEIEYQYLWDAIPESEWTTNVVYWRAVCSVVASIADGRAGAVKRAFHAAVNANCSCGGKGPRDRGACVACLVWHRSRDELATLDDK